MTHWKDQVTSFSKSDPEVEKLNQKAWDYARGYHGECNVWIDGPVGVGKTTLGFCIVNGLRETDSLKAVIVTGQQYLRVGTPDHPNRLFGEQWIRETPLFFLDDLDKTDPRLVRRFYEFMDVRHSYAKPVIITANCGPSELLKFWKEHEPTNEPLIEAAFDRLKPLKILRLAGKSLRPKLNGGA